jgi:hypothetical protein
MLEAKQDNSEKLMKFKVTFSNISSQAKIIERREWI